MNCKRYAEEWCRGQAGHMPGLQSHRALPRRVKSITCIVCRTGPLATLYTTSWKLVCHITHDRRNFYTKTIGGLPKIHNKCRLFSVFVKEKEDIHLYCPSAGLRTKKAPSENGAFIKQLLIFFLAHGTAGGSTVSPEACFGVVVLFSSRRARRLG